MKFLANYLGRALPAAYNPFRKPSPILIATEELEEAQRQLLRAQSAAEYARRMTEYHTDRVKRLTAFLKTAHGQNQQAEEQQ